MWLFTRYFELYSFCVLLTEILSTGQLSIIPWRHTDQKYTNKETYLKVIKERDAIIIDKTVSTVFDEVPTRICRIFYFNQ